MEKRHPIDERLQYVTHCNVNKPHVTIHSKDLYGSLELKSYLNTKCDANRVGLSSIIDFRILQK